MLRLLASTPKTKRPNNNASNKYSLIVNKQWSVKRARIHRSCNQKGWFKNPKFRLSNTSIHIKDLGTDNITRAWCFIGVNQKHVARQNASKLKRSSYDTPCRLTVHQRKLVWKFCRQQALGFTPYESA